MEQQKGALPRLGIHTVRDLLFHFPFRYDTAGDESTISGLVAGQEATVVGTLEKLETKKSWKRKIPVSEGIIKDASGKKIGRNDPCPCGSGLKYKRCGLINAPEHKR